MTSYVPKLRFKSFTEAWRNPQRFDSLSDRITDKFDPNNQESTKCIELEHIEKDCGIINGFADSRSQLSLKAVFRRGDILYGKLRPYLRKYYCAGFDGVCSSEIWVFRGRLVITPFLYYLLQTDGFNAAVSKSAGSKMPRAEWSAVAAATFAVPTTESEQWKIASFLSLLDKKLHQLERKLQLLKEYRKGTHEALFSQRVRFRTVQGVDYPSWVKRQLSEVLYESKQRNRELIYGREHVLSVSREYGVVNQIDYQGRSFAGVSLKDYKIVETGDVVYTKSPLRSNPYGVIKSNQGDAGVVSTLYAVYKCTPLVLPKYLDYYFGLDDNVNSYLRPLVNKGAKNDMKINNDRVLVGYIDLPSLKEQQRIVGFLVALDAKVAGVAQAVAACQKWKKGLLQQMFV